VSWLAEVLFLAFLGAFVYRILWIEKESAVLQQQGFFNNGLYKHSLMEDCEGGWWIAG